ncbi:hypothetical protein EVAR_58188_1 [Eumeta japonica]|uniref:Uncharacterized protein n=1 Tax=Eumeta variegata TaxID=151549 RepID=A0A4C1YQH3_EUMVA|nr:hypothetical protein EVAR_58188_1 [Eumeta japonica]
MKCPARRTFTNGLQDSSAVVSISMTNFVMVARPPMKNQNIDAVYRMIETHIHVTYHEIRASLDIDIKQVRNDERSVSAPVTKIPNENTLTSGPGPAVDGAPAPARLVHERSSRERGGARALQARCKRAH